MSPFYASPSESELVELANRIAQGDTVAENRLVQLYSERVRVMATHRTRDPEASKELVDDVMMAAIQALRSGKVRETGRLGAFIHGTAKNLINNFQRSRSRRPIMGQLPDNLPGLDGTDILESNSDFDQVWRSIEQLDARDRELLRLLFVEGKTPEEIAAHMGLTSDAVRQRKCRALKRLKAHFGKRRKQAAPDLQTEGDVWTANP
jgi:RNA polymerase sigma factor (sigma-70 family)